MVEYVFGDRQIRRSRRRRSCPRRADHEMLPTANVNGGRKLPSPFPTSTEIGARSPSMVPSRSFATARSSVPSRLKSPGDDRGRPMPGIKAYAGAGMSRRRCRAARRRCRAALFAAARSGEPSRLKSPTAIDQTLSVFPGAIVRGACNVPSPLPSSTEIRPDPALATATSVRLSRLTSPWVTKEGPLSARSFARMLNVPSPLPSSTDTSLDAPLAVARSARPSPSKSPAIAHAGPPPTPTCRQPGRFRRRCRQDQQDVGSWNRQHQIQLAIPVEVRDRQRSWTVVCAEVDRARRLERSVPVPEQHGRLSSR